MYFSRVAIVAVTAILSTGGMACQCYVNGSPANSLTESCCAELSGVFEAPGQCEASSISEHLSNFRSCCGGSSDCDYPSRSVEDAGEEK
ncbi:hypothetical protein VMCG_07573 [Cytospora schulzeri]|uniref:Extracellular membrane protein CFEM domain-containing protein n=1 Tax=Cytospora schulzeri TaxID=448051 RepID=A0A423VX77_9PEZI|nr:hypothetical protein VMCG_07573 [Valsa malicola]